MDDQTCSACGATAPAHARFCPQCGTGLPGGGAGGGDQPTTPVPTESFVPQLPLRHPEPTAAPPPWAPTPAGQWPQASSPSSPSSGRRAGTAVSAVLALTGAVLVAAGVFLPWAESGGETFGGWSISDDAKVQLLLGVGALLVGVALTVGFGRVACRLLLAGAGGAVAVIAVVDILSVQDEEADIGVGLVVLLVAAAFFLLGSALARPAPASDQ